MDPMLPCAGNDPDPSGKSIISSWLTAFRRGVRVAADLRCTWWSGLRSELDYMGARIDFRDAEEDPIAPHHAYFGAPAETNL